MQESKRGHDRGVNKTPRIGREKVVWEWRHESVRQETGGEVRDGEDVGKTICEVKLVCFLLKLLSEIRKASNYQAACACCNVSGWMDYETTGFWAQM